MQQNIVTAFLTALFTLVLSVITALGQNNPPCVAPPPPANLTVTGVTTNSVSLSWTVSGPYTSSYRIDVKDITAGGFTYPPLYTNALQYTVGGLLPGHLHEFKVYAYYYLTCPLSSPAIINQATLTFIVEDIVSIQSRCEPGTFFHKETNSLPLQPCIAPFEPTYQNDYVGRVKAPGAADAFTFRIIYIPYNSNGVREVRIAPVGYIPLRYSFSPPCSPCLAATCSYTDDNGKKVTLLTVAGAFFSPQSQQATAIISFGSSCDYAYCGSACLPAQPGKTQLVADRDESNGAVQIQSTPTTPPSPNPFTESTTLQYDLASPTLVSIQLYDAVGHLVQTVQSATQLPAGEYTATVDGRMLPKGAYFIVVQKGDQRQLFTLMKQD